MEVSLHIYFEFEKYIPYLRDKDVGVFYALTRVDLASLLIRFTLRLAPYDPSKKVQEPRYITFKKTIDQVSFPHAAIHV